MTVIPFPAAARAEPAADPWPAWVRVLVVVGLAILAWVVVTAAGLAVLCFLYRPQGA